MALYDAVSQGLPRSLRRGVTAAAMTAKSTAIAVAKECPEASLADREAYADWFTERCRQAFLTEWRAQSTQESATPMGMPCECETWVRPPWARHYLHHPTCPKFALLSGDPPPGTAWGNDPLADCTKAAL